MKKTIAILLAVLMTCSLLAFAGCGSKPAGGEKTSKPDTATTAPGDKPSEAADTTSAQLIADEVASPLQEWVDGDVTYNYCTMNTPDGTMGYFLITSEKDEEIGIELKLTPKDASGAVVGDDDLTFTISTIAPGTTKMTAYPLAENRHIDVASIDLEPTYKKAFGHDAEPFLSVEELDNESGEKGVTLAVTNNGEKAVGAYISVAFFNENMELIGVRGDYTYGDTDSATIEPGETRQPVVISFDRDYAGYEYYISAEYFG